METDLFISARWLLIDFENRILPIPEQASLPELNRSGLFYHPVPPDETDLMIKKHIKKIYTVHPEFRYRRICAWIKRYDGIKINHKAVLRHMQEMRIQDVYPRQNTGRPESSNPVYPYL